MPVIYYKHGQTIVDLSLLRYNFCKFEFFAEKNSTVSEKMLQQNFKVLYETFFGGNWENQGGTKVSFGPNFPLTTSNQPRGHH